MVKYSDDTDYEQIDLAALYELRDARLVLAQIVAIDRINNCAEITIEEECAALTGKDLSAVPFFYHCEDSTGTLEDLERGHKAFSVDDYVYCLWSPEVGDLAERFYIIGHYDIKGIMNCRSEILYLKTAEQSDPASGYVYCLFDAGTGTLLDLEHFTNIDEGSPPKPTSAIGIGSQNVDDWVEYNFIDVIPTVTIPYYSSYEIYPNMPSPSAMVFSPDVFNETYYTGTKGWMISSTPIVCADKFNSGNGLYTGIVNANISESSGLITGSHSIDISKTNPFYAQVTDHDCRASWGHQESKVTTIYRSTDSFRTRIKLTDPTSLEVVTLGCSFSDMIQKESYSDLSANGNLTAEVHSKQSIKINTHFGGFAQLNKSYEFTASALTTYSNSAPFAPCFTQGNFVRDSGVGSYLCGTQLYIGEHFTSPDIMGPSKPIFTGEFAAYCITGVSVYIEEYFNTDSNLSTGQGDLAKRIVMPGHQDTSSMCNNGFGDSQAKVHFTNNIMVWNDHAINMHIAPFAFVSPFTDEFGSGETETIQNCFLNTDTNRSIGLGKALQDTFTFFLSHVNTLGFNRDEYYNFYKYTAIAGISETRIIKRKSA